MSEVKTIYLKDYTNPDFSCKRVDLVFNIYEEYTLVTNTMSLHKENDVENILLDSIDLELIELYLNDLKLNDTRYVHIDNILKIMAVPENFTIKVVNKIYPHKNTELEGLYKSGDIFCTQNEPEGFRRITPYLDRPDVMSVFTTTVIADKKSYPILLSNGNKKECIDFMNGRHGITWFDPHPKPSYLFALVAGDLGELNDTFKTMSGNEVELNIYCDKGNESKCLHAMKSLKEAMIWDEQKYGREYDLDIYNIVAVDSFNMGAMENKGLNIFNSHYVLANEEVATDQDFMGIQSVIAHEYFHNWTGNRITCKNWFQLTLKEGLTVFRDQCFSADLNSKEVQRIEEVKALRERQFVEDASPTSHPIQPESYISMNNFYTSTVYEKGAEVIRMIHTLLGEEKYRKATDLYFDTFDGRAVTTEDFLWAMSEAGDIDLSQFERWYHQNGTPKLLVGEKYVDGIYTLRLTQVIPNTLDGERQKVYMYPLKIALLGNSGEELVEQTLIISKEYEEFHFTLDAQPILSLNRDFSAPIIVEQEHSSYPFLMRYDNNSFVRYESAQLFAIETLESMMQGDEINEEFVKSYGVILKADIDLSFKALLLELPTVSTLMQRQSVIDFEPIYKAKEDLQKYLASTYKKEFINVYVKNHDASSQTIDALSMSQRAIKNNALKMLSCLDTQEINDLVLQQYEASLTMTDKITALDILENVTEDIQIKPMKDFYAKYKLDTLVMNKYFSILAASQRAGVLQRVIELQEDEVYDPLVPNLVRSLIGVFARNYKYFHAKDGSGYKFVCDKVLEIDKVNPQISSALISAFKIYKKMNQINQNVMRIELECVVSTQSLSKNCFEILGKILK